VTSTAAAMASGTTVRSIRRSRLSGRPQPSTSPSGGGISGSSGSASDSTLIYPVDPRRWQESDPATAPIAVADATGQQEHQQHDQQDGEHEPPVPFERKS
jgi:hypothetical protein